MVGIRSVFVFILLALSIGASTSRATELVPIEPSQIQWAVGDPSTDPADASAETSQVRWATGESARKATLGAKQIRASFIVPKGPWHAPTLLLGGVTGFSELWIDGKKHHSVEVGEIINLASLPFPPSAIGKRVEVRIVGINFPTNITSVSVGEGTSVTEEVLRQGIAASNVGLLMLVFALIALIGWSFIRRERFSLRLAAFGAASGAMAFGLGPASPLIVGAPLSSAALYVGVGLFPWATMAMVRNGFAEHTPAWTVWIERVTLAWGVFLIVARFTAGSTSATVLAPMTFVPALAASVYIGYQAARPANTDHGSRVDGRRLLVGLMLFFGVILFDLAGLFGLRETTGFHVHWGLLFVVGTFLSILARRLVEAADTLQVQASTLAASEKEGRAVTRRLLADANELLAAVGQLRDSGAAQNETIEKQAAALQETHVTAEEIRRTSTLASEKAQALLAQAAVADETQRAGEQAVVESLAGLESISGEVAAMAVAMNEVDNLAREIGGIVDVVKELADQSNMLALNAAIEAVRSGEHGKGFAVVAREVRRLADQSIQSTERIRGVLERLADGVRQSTSAGERGEQSVATALERLRGSGDQMRSMSDILRETNAAVRQISAAVTQQNAGISQIFTAVEHLSEQMKEAVRRVQEAESATVVVETVASRMSNNRSVA